MNASKFTEAQKAFILKQGEEGTSVAEICRKAGIGQSTYFAWKKKYGGLLPDEMRRLKQLRTATYTATARPIAQSPVVPATPVNSLGTIADRALSR